MWMNPGLGMKRIPRKPKIAFRNYRKIGDLSGLRKSPQKKGRPPPGGEEAEVVVNQPRGVGLMHTRHKPGNAHYTHASPEGRKCSLLTKPPQNAKVCSHRQVS